MSSLTVEEREELRRALEEDVSSATQENTIKDSERFVEVPQ